MLATYAASRHRQIVPCCMISSVSHDNVSRLVTDRSMCFATALDKAFENIDCMSAILRCQAKNRFYESTQRLIQPRRVLCHKIDDDHHRNQHEQPFSHGWLPNRGTSDRKDQHRRPNRKPRSDGTRSGATAAFSWGLLAAAKKHHCIVYGKVKFRNLSKVIWLGGTASRRPLRNPIRCFSDGGIRPC